MDRITHHPVIDPEGRARKVGFTFDGQALEGIEGEAITSALTAAGILAYSHHVRDGAPQGLFCANGQCSQCSLLVDGFLRKACVTPLAEGLDLRSLRGNPCLPEDERPFAGASKRRLDTEVLIVGAGPSGLAAAKELSRLGLDVIIADDKEALGGKLLLQTHKFFGSEADCYAGTRGVDIAATLEREVRALPGVRVLAHSPVVGVYKDGVAGIHVDCRDYVLVGFKALLVAAGAREKSVLFQGNGLPGVYGAGAFQTLVNRDLVRPATRVLIVGSGNVGLIAAYHALQAGIEVAAIVDILGKVGGYEVHADKIRRMGVPILLGTGVVSVEGQGRVERATIAEVDGSFRPILETARTYAVDTVLVAAGLSPCDELHRQASSFGLLSVTAGDAEEIAEASSAMFGGRIAAISLAKLLGKKVDLDPGLVATREVLKSRPGDHISRDEVVPGKDWQPVFFCTEEIPCNPCTTVCPTKSISLRPRKASLLDLPYYKGSECAGCSACVAACPGLAVSLVRKLDDAHAEVLLPWEFEAEFAAGTLFRLLDKEGAFLEEAPLLSKRYYRKRKTWVLAFRVSLARAPRAAGIAVQAAEATQPLPEPSLAFLPDEAILCRCERITVGEIRRYIQDQGIRDANQLKSLRVAMGSCGSRTCGPLLPQVFRQAGVDPGTVAPLRPRPLGVEVTMGDLVNEGRS